MIFANDKQTNLPGKHKLGQNDLMPFVIASGFFLAVFLLLYYTCGVFYLTNDDSGIMKTFSGYSTGIPSAYHPYCSYLLGTINKLLYSIYPKLNWYTYGSILTMILSNAVIATVLYKTLDKETQKNKAAIILLGIVTLAVNFYGIKRISWTLNGLFASIAGTMLLFKFLFEKKHKLRTIIFSAILLGTGAVIRFSSFESVIPFILLIMIYYVAVKSEKPFFSKKNTEVFRNILLVIFLLGVIWGCNSIDDTIKKRSNPADTTSSEFEVYRSIYDDADHISYYGNEEFYESIGWDEELYIMTENWFSMDSRFNTENLKKIVERSKEVLYSNSEVPSQSSYLHVFWIYTQSDPVRLFLTVSVILLMVISTYLTIRKIIAHKDWKDWFLISGATVLSIAEWIWLIVAKERFIDRAYYCATIPALFISIWVFSKLYTKVHTNRSLCRILFSFIILCFGMIATFWIVEDEREKIRYLSMVSAEADEIAASHPETLYITDITVADGCNLFPDLNMPGCPDNKLLYGGSSIFGKEYYNTVSRFGYDEFYSDGLFNENVLFITTEPDFENSDMMRYMRKCYGDSVDAVLVERYESGILIYHFVQ